VYFILLNRSVVAILVDVKGVSSWAMLSSFFLKLAEFFFL